MIDGNEILKIFDLLNKNDIEYVLIKNINNELPNRLKNGKDIDVIVHPNSLKLYRKLMLNNGFIQTITPFGKLNGWTFIDKTLQTGFYMNMHNGICLDIYTELCCKTLRNKCWASLGQCYQERVWKYKFWDRILECWKLDDITLLAYLCVRSVFEKHAFLPEYIAEIETRKVLLTELALKKMLKSVFFNYSDRLLALIHAGQYHIIINEFFEWR